MTLKQLKAKADIVLAAFWNVLKTKQEAYFAKHGKYFQLLVSPTNDVVDGVDSTFTVRHPSDDLYQMDVDFPWTEKIPFNIEVHEWGGNNRGYMAIVTVALTTGKKYQRTRTSDNVDSGWYELITNVYG